MADTDSGYRKLKLYLETQLRNAYTTSEQITIADKGALDLATYQLTPTDQGTAAAPRPPADRRRGRAG